MLKEMKRIQQVVRWAASNSCEMSDSVNLSGICLLTQLYNLPLLSAITASSYTETRVVSTRSSVSVCCCLFDATLMRGEHLCVSVSVHSCVKTSAKEVYFYTWILSDVTRHVQMKTRRPGDTRTALELTSHTYSLVSVILRGSLIPVFTPSCEI